MPIVHEGPTGNIVVIYHPFGSKAHFSQRHPEPHGTARGCLASFRTPGSGDAIDSLARGPSRLPQVDSSRPRWPETDRTNVRRLCYSSLTWNTRS